MTSHCPKCDEILPADAPEGICPSCLLLAGLEGDDEMENSPFAVTTPHPARFVPPDPAIIAPFFPQYEVLELLGHGGMGAVYRARQIKLDRMVALKVIRPEAAADPAFAERFTREAKTLARLNHPGIVGVHDFGEVAIDNTTDGTDSSTLYYFAMEYVDGANLRQLISAAETDAAHSLAIISQICEALQYAHAEGVVHRDIKPENILVNSLGKVKIADFGLARLIATDASDFTLTGTHQVMGTPQYMAPEQMAGSKGIDHRADIYSLGVVFYELLTGEVPMGQFEPPSRKSSVDVRLDNVVMRALAREPERRYQTASELKLSVDGFTAGGFAAETDSLPEQQPNYRAGMSTVFEREAVAAWHWVTGAPDVDSNSARSKKPQRTPWLFMLMLAAIGCLTPLMPWIDVEIVPSEPVYQPTVQLQSKEAILCLWQDQPVAQVEAEASTDAAAPAYAEISEPGDVLFKSRATFYGADKWPGIVVAVAFGILAFILISIPATHLRLVRWSLLMTIVAAMALLHTFLFRVEVLSMQVAVSPGRLAEVSADAAILADQQHLSNHKPVVFQDAPASSYRQSISDVEHRIGLRFGFFTALGLSVSLLVLSATGIRHGVTEKKDQPQATGTPLARHSFVTAQQEDIANRIRMHFFSYGYALQENGAQQLVFHRGSKAASLTSMNIRAYHTTLTVRITTAGGSNVQISCLWQVKTMGALIFGKDTKTLENEGRDLEAALPGGSDNQQAAHASRPGPMEPSAPAIPVPVMHEAGATPELDEEEELDLAHSFADGPGTAMGIVGLLMLLLSGTAGLFLMLMDGEGARMAWVSIALIVPGLFVGPLLIVGGLQMRSLSSAGAAMMGAIAAVLPITAAWIITLPIGIWALVNLNRRQVARGFSLVARQRRTPLRVQRTQFSRKAIVGAVLIGCAMIAIPMYRSIELSTVILVVLTLPIIIPGLLSPIVSTMLGLQALTEIRNSHGRVTGLGLAFFDAIFFPAVILNFTVGWIIVQTVDYPFSVPRDALLLGATIAIVINVLLIRQCWRNATRDHRE